MNIEEQFNLVSKEYDENRRKFIPCYDDYYEATTRFISSNINEPKNILDLGSGTGLLSYYWYKVFPNANYMLVDIADDMLKVARERFLNLKNIRYEVLDYIKSFPNEDYDCIISALSIHHLSYIEKKHLFKKIYDKLPKGGVFVNYDQFCAGTDIMNKWFDTYWIGQLENSGLTQKDIDLWEGRRKLDKECSVEEEIEMLKDCNFTEVNYVYSSQKFSVIVAIK
jgi:ubiquinone/menaquinone biosynthesis C-methylase UbiE